MKVDGLFEVPISLYLKTRQGEHTDLKVVAKAALTFAEIIEAAARAIDPDLIVKVEVVSGTEGSFGLNTLNKVKVAASNLKQGVIAGWKKHEKARFRRPVRRRRSSRVGAWHGLPCRDPTTKA